MSEAEIHELRERHFDSFFAAPFEAYGAQSPFVSPLRSDLARFTDTRRHPTFRSPDELTYFSLLRQGRPIGRIVACVHRASNDRFGTARAQFGLFDCVDDERAADLLLEAAERFAVRQGARELVGNFNLTGNHAIGVVTDGFDRAPYIEQTYNPAHVVRLLERRGYERFFPMRTWELDVDHHAADGLWGDKQRRLLADSGLRVEPVRRRTLRRQMDECRELLNRAFDRNPLFVPMTKQEFDFYAKDLMWIVDPRITVVAYDGARAVGAIVCVPDLNPLFRRIRSRVSVGAILPFLRYRRACRRATMIYYAVDPEHQNRGVNGVMLHALVGQLARAGYTHVGGTWIADENVASLRQAEKLGARVHQRLHLFRRALAS